MNIIPPATADRTTEQTGLTTEDVQLFDLLALHIICGTLREARA